MTNVTVENSAQETPGVSSSQIPKGTMFTGRIGESPKALFVKGCNSWHTVVCISGPNIGGTWSHTHPFVRDYEPLEDATITINK